MNLNMINENWVSLASSISSIAALLVSVIALYYAHLALALKSRTRIRGSFTFAQSISCEDRYVSDLTLVNVKDRALAVYSIHIIIGNRHFIEVEDRQDDPIILEPFGIYRRNYDPINFYAMNMRTYDLNALIASDKVRKRIVLATSEGRYVVREWARVWLPVIDYFKNHLTGLFTPGRLLHSNGKAYGGNVEYLVELTFNGNEPEVIPIFSGAQDRNPFKNIKLPPEALASADELERHIMSSLTAIEKPADLVKVFDLRGANTAYFEMYAHKREPVKNHSWAIYWIVGRLLTWYANVDLYWQNRKTARTAKHKPYTAHPVHKISTPEPPVAAEDASNGPQ